MPEPDFHPSRKTLEEILSGPDFLLIPRFQRPYSWDRGILDEFWNDVFKDNSAGYFIGPMVVWRKSSTGPQLYVVDGQQRLMTVTMLLAALRNAFSDIGNSSLAEGAHNFIEKPNRDNIPQFILQSENRSPYVDNHILSSNRDGTAEPTTDEERGIKLAFDEIEHRVSQEIEGKRRPGKETALKKLRDHLLALRVIWVEHNNEDDAYVVFETLNTRGKDLEVVDLLKNYLLSLLRGQRNPNADVYRDQWIRVRSGIEESQVSIDINRYLLHWWLSQEDYVAQRKLFKAFKEKIRTKESAIQRLGELEADTYLYRKICEPGNTIWTNEESAIRRSLSALTTFGVTQPAPVLLAMLRARREYEVGLPYLRSTFKTIERFHFQFTSIAKNSSSGGISEMYARHARELTRSQTKAQRVEKLKSLRTALVARAPDNDVFESSFASNLVYTNDLARDKKLVQYVLQTMLEFTNPTTASNPCTIEHILPQDQIGVFDATVVGNIGNLLWLPESINTELSNKTFDQKKRILKKYRGAYDIEDILSASSWGSAEIETRANRLAQMSRQSVWKLPV